MATGFKNNKETDTMELEYMQATVLFIKERKGRKNAYKEMVFSEKRKGRFIPAWPDTTKEMVVQKADTTLIYNCLFSIGVRLADTATINMVARKFKDELCTETCLIWDATGLDEGFFVDIKEL